MTTIYVSTGSTFSGTVSAADTLDVESGGTALNALVSGAETLSPYLFATANVSGFATSDTVVAGGQQNIDAGGIASDTIVQIEGGEIVYAGGQTTSATVSGVEEVDGGTAFSDTVASGGRQSVFAGSASGTIIQSGGTEIVDLTGQTTGATVHGIEYVEGLAISDTVTNAPPLEEGDTAYPVGGTQYVERGGTASGTIVQSGALETVDAGGQTIGATVSGQEYVYGLALSDTVDGVQYVSAGGSDSGTIIQAGGLESVEDGQTTSALVSGTLNVYEGSAISDTVASGGQQFLPDGVDNSASGTIIQGGGEEFVGILERAIGETVSGLEYVLGSALSNTVASGGTEYVMGGSASGTIVQAGALETVYAGGQTIRATVSGTEDVDSYGTAISDTVSSGGTQTVYAGGTASGTILQSGATLVMSGGSASAIVLNVGANVDLTSDSFQSGDTASVTDAELTLYTSNGGIVDNRVGVAGDYTGALFTVTSDGQGGTEITEESICYVRGTRVLTPTGERWIEDLAIGDRIVTRFGGVQPIRWIGRQIHTAAAVRGNRNHIPVQFRAGALGENLPARNLYVSPGHSMLIDSTLVLAKFLVNGITITQDWLPETLEYFQLELEGHDCVIAEGTWSETFADGPGLRDRFHNLAEFHTLFPDHRPPDELAPLCAPRPQRGAALAAALQPIVKRASTGLLPGKLRGYVERVRGEWKVEGWAQDIDHPLLPVLLEVVLEDKVIGTVLACDFREDLLTAIGNENASFVFESPVKIRSETLGSLQVRRAADGALLVNSRDLLVGRASESSQPNARPAALGDGERVRLSAVR